MPQFTALDLRAEAPLSYAAADQISTTSGTEAFEAGIDSRDGGSCVVCGLTGIVQYCHIVPKGEHTLVRR
jgi:hypothetical protein